MGIILTEILTGSSDPADNLICLRKMIDYIRLSIPIVCDDRHYFLKSGAEGLFYILTIIAHDLELLSEKVIREIGKEDPKDSSFIP